MLPLRHDSHRNAPSYERQFTSMYLRGFAIAKITLSRGFAIELGSAIVIIIGTRLEIPLSTSHCQVGATTGVALLEGTGDINGVVLGKTVLGWIITIIMCAITCSLIFAQGAYAFDTIDQP